MKQAEWTDEAISRLFTYYNTHQGSPYFSMQVGQAIIRYTRPFLGEARNVLDYGCGPGFLSKYLLDNYFKVTAMDFTEDSVKKAADLCRDYDNFLGAFTYSEFSKHEHKYDVIFVIEVIEHLSDHYLEDMMANLRKYAGGYVVITTPNDEDLSKGMLYCPFCDTQFHGVQHMRTWNAETLTMYLDKNGFDVKHVNAVNLRELYSPKIKLINRMKKIWRKMNGIADSDKKPHLICIAKYRDG